MDDCCVALHNNDLIPKTLGQLDEEDSAIMSTGKNHVESGGIELKINMLIGCQAILEHRDCIPV
jgi:hypothetical protein